MAFIGWLVMNRDEVLAQITPMFPDVIAHHVTFCMLPKGKSLNDYELTVVDGVIIDVVTNDKVQAAVVEMNGSADRPDGGTYHITWSIDREAGAKPFHSNQMIAELGYSEKMGVPVKLIPFQGY